MAKSRVTFPDGTEVEIAKDATPDQITAILNALQHRSVPSSQQKETSGKVVEHQPTPEEIWDNGSKREKLALFIRNHFLKNQWFTTIEVRDEQLQFVKRLVFGESPAIGTYLNRLHDDGYLKKRKQSNRVYFQLKQEILDQYPVLELEEISTLLQTRS